jgi:alanine racemase
MNRLGLDWRSFDAAMLGGLNIGIVHSHLACADEPQHPLNKVQLDRIKNVLSGLPGVSASIASSGGICLGRDYSLNHVRPGLGLYGGTPGPAAAGHVAQVVQPEARIIQVRDVPKGDSAGYGATWVASKSSRIAVINVGYADGYLRCFSNAGTILVDGKQAPVVGRISMDLVIADVTDAPAVGPGDWVGIAYDLLSAASVTDLSQYELLTGLGARYSRIYQ